MIVFFRNKKVFKADNYFIENLAPLYVLAGGMWAKPLQF